MSSVADPQPSVSPLAPTAVAALLLAAREQLRRLELPHPTSAQILEATGAGRSRAYELCKVVLESLIELLRPAGRPPKAPAAPASDVVAELSRALLCFVMDHPGSVGAGPQRKHYSRPFIHFVLELRRQHADMDLDIFAHAVSVPVGTLKGWLNPNFSTVVDEPPAPTTPPETPPPPAPQPGTPAAGADNVSDTSATDEAAPATTNEAAPADRTPPATDADANDTTVASTNGSSSVVGLYIETIVVEWKRWEGPFGAFCDHLQKHHRIPFGRTLIGNVLGELGERTPRRRSGRSPDERALRGTFETFFPGAQWVGDGTSVEIVFGDQCFTFNLELLVDAHSDGFVGMSVRDTEDSAAVVEAFDDAVTTTGEPPIATLLDNRPSNHAPEVDDALGDTVRIRATRKRPQNKAHCEGAFGLFEPLLPALVISSTLPQEQARQVVALVFQVLLRALNHRPRSDRNGRSRVDLYRDYKPTGEEIAQARAALEERARKQRLARETLRARQDPRKHELLDELFERFGLPDPEHHTRTAIARYPFDAIVDGIAIFEAKASVGSLVDDHRERYLLGIVKNCAAQTEGDAVIDNLIRRRRAAHDALLASLEAERDAIYRFVADPNQRIDRFLDAAVDSERKIDRLFWLDAAGHVIAHSPRSLQDDALRDAARRLYAAFDVPPRERQDMTRHLTGLVIPLA